MVKVVTDSSCDIPSEMARKLSITIVPLYIEFGGKTYRDGVDLHADRLHHELLHARQVPKTSVPSPGDFLKVYNDLASETDEIVSIHLSSEFSGTYNAARLAKGYLDAKCRVEVMDSKLVSAGLGLALSKLARWARTFAPIKQAGIAYSTVLDEAEMLAGHLEAFLPKEHIVISRLGCATLTYGGPGSLLMAVVCDEQP